MIERPHTDKTRFVDCGFVEGRGPFVHTVEVSDERSTAHFVTFFVSQMTQEMRAVLLPLIEAHDLNAHDPDTYHRDDRFQYWIDTHFDRKHREGWSKHLHWRFDRQPGRAEVLVVLDALGPAVSEALRSEIASHYAMKEAA